MICFPIDGLTRISHRCSQNDEMRGEELKQDDVRPRKIAQVELLGVFSLPSGRSTPILGRGLPDACGFGA